MYLDIFDHFCATYVLLFNVLLEIILISWVYGAERFMGDVQRMLPVKLTRFWFYDWKYICPIATFVLLVIGLTDEFETPYGGYPTG